jgi:hypothetical protein
MAKKIIVRNRRISENGVAIGNQHGENGGENQYQSKWLGVSKWRLKNKAWRPARASISARGAAAINRRQRNAFYGKGGKAASANICAGVATAAWAICGA